MLDDRYVAEVLEPGGTTAAAAGAIGELVLTNLGRVGQPAHPLPDRRRGARRERRGRGDWLLLDGGILGRTDDMIHVRGNNLYPAAIEAVVRRFAEVAEFRIVVDRSGPLADLRVEVEPADGGRPAGLADAVARAIRDELLFRVAGGGRRPGHACRGSR